MTDRAYTQAICDRLRAAYSAHALLPRSDGLHGSAACEELRTGVCACDHQYGYRLGLNQLQRLFRAVVSEGYGS